MAEYKVVFTDHDPLLGGVTEVLRFGSRADVVRWAERELADTLEVMPDARVTCRVCATNARDIDVALAEMWANDGR